MSTRRNADAKPRALRPAVDGLEPRALLSIGAVRPAEVHALGSHGARRLSTIDQVARAGTAEVSTVPANGDVNPYGVAFVPSRFPAGGTLGTGDVLVSNFNASTNLQGTGTTIVRITPAGQRSVFYQGPPGVGLSTALGVLRAGYVVVGSLPSTDGTSATAGQGSLLILDRSGKLVQTLTDPALLNGPWDLTVNDLGSRAQVFVSNALSGAVTRINLSFPSAGGVRVMSTVQVASGYIHRGDPAAFELGPTGLAYNARTGVLYVASTADNAVYAVARAGTRSTDAGTGRVIYRDGTHLHGPLGLTFVGDGNLIAAQGDAINPSPTQTSELVEFTPSGRFVGQFSISGTAGGAFGVASGPGGTRFAAVNDINNAVRIVAIRP